MSDLFSDAPMDVTWDVPLPAPCLFFQSACFSVLKCWFLKSFLGVFQSKICSRGIVWVHVWPYNAAHRLFWQVWVVRMRMTKPTPHPHPTLPGVCVCSVCFETRSQGLKDLAAKPRMVLSPQSSCLHLLNSRLTGIPTVPTGFMGSLLSHAKHEKFGPKINSTFNHVVYMCVYAMCIWYSWGQWGGILWS